MAGWFRGMRDRMANMDGIAGRDGIDGMADMNTWDAMDGLE